MNTAIIILAILVRSDGEINRVDVAQVRDMPTCQTLAAAFNAFTADNPDVAASCREVRRTQT